MKYLDNTTLLKNKIELYGSGITQFQKALATYIHEQLHATSTLRDDVSGFSKPLDELDIEEHHIAITEAVTEWISQTIMYEYLVQVGSTGTESVESEFFESGYFEYQQTLEVYTRLLSFISEVPIDTVRGGIIRGYLRNGDILPGELHVELQDAAPGTEFHLAQAIESGDPADLLLVATDLRLAGIISQEQHDELIAVVQDSNTARDEYFAEKAVQEKEQQAA